MDAAKLLEEHRLAQEEHARALADVEQIRRRLEIARAEADEARASQHQYERDMEIAAAKIAEALQAMQLGKDDIPRALPPVKDYLVEYQANIGCYHCYLFVSDGGAEDVDTSVLSVSVDVTKVVISSAAGTWWTLEFERKVDPENCTITTKDDHIYVRLPVGESDKETVDGFSSFSQTSPKELRVDSYSTLGCRGCKAVLMEKSPVDKVLPLPSDNWREMFDFWGAGIGSFEHIPREGIFAHEHRVFVGEATIIVHEKDLQDQAVLMAAKVISIHAKDDEEQPDWVQVSCSACSVVLGERRTENPTTLRLQKHLITAASFESPEVNVFERYTIDSTISAQMLHIAESDGVFRFRLHAPSDGHEEPAFSGLQLQLMNWDARIRASKLSSCATEFQRVLKVIYSSTAPRPAAAVSPVLPEQAALPPMLHVHELSVTRAVSGEILRRLKQSTLLLPASQRSFNKMAVGYLFA